MAAASVPRDWCVRVLHSAAVTSLPTGLPVPGLHGVPHSHDKASTDGYGDRVELHGRSAPGRIRPSGVVKHQVCVTACCRVQLPSGVASPLETPQGFPTRCKQCLRCWHTYDLSACSRPSLSSGVELGAGSAGAGTACAAWGHLTLQPSFASLRG